MSSNGGASSSSKGQGLFRNLLTHLSFSLDAFCFIVAFWMVDRLTFGSAESQARKAAEKAKREQERSFREEEGGGYFGKWWKKKDGAESPLLSSSPRPRYSASEPTLRIPADISSPLGSGQPTRSLSSEATAPKAPSLSSPSNLEIHHFQKKILKKQMARSLRLATVLRKIFLTLGALAVFLLAALGGGMDVRAHISWLVGSL